MRRPWVFLVAGALMLAACGGGGSHPNAGSSTSSTAAPAPATGNALTSPGRENVAFYYQPMRDSSVSKIGKVSLVVAGKSAARHSVVEIKKLGAKAFRGVQAYWFAEGDTYDGLEITKRSDWAFCATGSTPFVARTDANGKKWYFLDANERAVRAAFAARLKTLRLQGWDGVFFDRGFAALTGRDDTTNTAWNKVSTCTADPVDPKATLSDAYVGMASEVKRAGLELIMNYGVSPFDASTPLRPDPRDPKCANAAPGCRTLSDVWRSVDGVLDEAVAHPKDEMWDNDFRSNTLNEQMAKQGKNVIGLITEGTMGGQSTRENAYFEWARVKLFVIPLGVNTGDDNCGTKPGAICNRHGLFPELANIVFGNPLEAAPESVSCSSGSKIHCIWVRKYAQGMSVVNVSPSARSSGSMALGVDGCRYVKDVSTGQPVAGNACVKAVTLNLAAWSGHPLVYGERPW
ncbi:MAG: hypothetical protein ACXV9P_13855 [Acidimicrobiia bacterium]